MLNTVSGNVSAIATSLRQHLPFSSQQDLDITPYYRNMSLLSLVLALAWGASLPFI